jgi:UDP-glucose 4-epimerase
MERILVTGGAGYVGSVCCAQLIDRGYSVEVLDDLSAGDATAVPRGARLHQFDIGNQPKLEALLGKTKFDAVFHFAAKALIPESVTNPAPFFQNNVSSGLTLLEALRKHGVRKFVFSSSAAVYGSPKDVPILENHTTEPVNAYGESKLMFERILQWYAFSYGWSITAFRYFNACGGAHSWGEKHDPETHIIPLLLQVAAGRRKLFEIYGSDYLTADGTCLRDYVHVLDIAEAHILALENVHSPGFHVYNIGTGWSYSVQEVCRAVEEITQRKILTRRAARRAGDPAILCACPDKLMTELGWEPKHSKLSEIILGAWEWEQAQHSECLAISR